MAGNHTGMYSTRRINKNIVEGNAYITIGDPFKETTENPFLKKKGDKTPAPFQIKMIPANADPLLKTFAKPTYAAGGFQESIKYITTQPLDSRKNGFGTKDAKRRDEFSNAVRTEQYRSTIKKENEVMQKGSAKLQDTLHKLLEERSKTATFTSTSPYTESVPQYDIGRTRVTPFDPKSLKDTFYKFDGSRDKRFGDSRPASVDVGDGAANFEYKPPAFGGRSETKYFFDKSHLVSSSM